MSEKMTQSALYLTFKLEDEMFSVEVSQVREILDFTPITKIPRTPDFVRGVINVRGSVVPVVDMRLKFGMKGVESTVHTRIVVLEVNQDGETTVLGALADSVHDVIELEADQIEDPPRLGSRWRTEFIKGIGKHNGMFIIILDIDRVFSSDELALLDTTSTKAPAEETA
ncbi:MAG: chemotaxis protein CheW [Pseudomonadota bacterium]